MAFIEVKELVKEYEISVRKKGLLGSISSLLMPEYVKKRAVDSIGFSIAKGETVGFIGPNGAGKSTTVKMLTGILVPTSGTISIGGLSPHRDRKLNARRIGVVFGQRTQLWWDLPVADTFDLLRYVYRIPEQRYKRNMELFGELLGLQEFIRQPVRQLSLGQKMRADIAAAMLHDPEIIFFDEPTIGLDVVAKENIRTFIRQMNKEKGTTMLFTTHDMVDIEKTCERMIIIDKGLKIYDGTVEEIKDHYGKERTLSVEFAEPVGQVFIPGVELIEDKGTKKRFRFSREDIQASAILQILMQKYPILDFTVQEPDIDGIIREIYQGGISLDESLPGVC
ncbi:ABC-2 type transport system ATP-binding protein [Paenibacillus sp. UNCCL117]|uniref:ABC transporter ATP-binding protein n=1 Tax=unclassified Paenibacillus TaxID=185978 RepID=UPI0008887AC3|nr:MULTISPECIES: ATP-binding cassette domain-containing protein [unclassified Paenibacillus]SDD05649.1 ABC-2 type transport system ATP-binding protein [Paenibacillus sp. cl123]SFW31856.1 ABC-2 type transport system ATP-binding protein [Paenibacillus sp. UNCCL117]